MSDEKEPGMVMLLGDTAEEDPRKELDQALEDLVEIYEDLAAMITADKDPSFVRIVADLGMIKSNLATYIWEQKE